MELIDMLKFNNRGLALAIAAALTLPATAMAATVDFVPASVNKTYASNLFQNPATSVLTPATIAYKTQVSDNIIGRTTGFGVRLTLAGGPTFGSTAPVVTLGGNATGFTPGGGSGALASIAACNACWPASVRNSGLPPNHRLASTPSAPATNAALNMWALRSFIAWRGPVLRYPC